MVFDEVEDRLEFYKGYIIYLGFSICSDLSGKNKSGNYCKWFVCSKDGFHQPAKTSKIPIMIVEAITQSKRRT